MSDTLGLHNITRPLGDSRIDSEVILSGGGISKDTLTSEKLLLGNSELPEDERALRKASVIYGQSLTDYAFYPAAYEVLHGQDPDYAYKGLRDHGSVAEKLVAGGRVLVADIALFGEIEDSRSVMPNVFTHSQIIAEKAVIMPVGFVLAQHKDTVGKTIENWSTQPPVKGHCKNNIAQFLGGLNYIEAPDSSYAAMKLAETGGYIDGVLSYVICSPFAAESLDLEVVRVMNDKASATRFVSYSSSGVMPESGQKIAIAVRTPNTQHALLDALIGGFDGYDLSGLVQLNRPDQEAHFAIETSATIEDAHHIVRRLQSIGIDARPLGRYDLIDKRVLDQYPDEYDYESLRTDEKGQVTVCVDMLDQTGSLTEKLTKLKDEDINIDGIRVAPPKKDMSRVLAIDIHANDAWLAERALKDFSPILV